MLRLQATIHCTACSESFIFLQIGVTLVLLIRPGEGLTLKNNATNVTADNADVHPLDALLDLIRSIPFELSLFV